MSHTLPLADIQFIADFAAFARSKGDGGYEEADGAVCALAQFGYVHIVDSGDCARQGVPWAAYHAAALCPGPYTFSALADRLEALIADAPVVVRA
jgi:hypothetical protein